MVVIEDFGSIGLGGARIIAPILLATYFEAIAPQVVTHLSGDPVRFIDDGDENVDDNKRGREAEEKVEGWSEYLVQIAQLAVKRPPWRKKLCFF